MRRKSLARRATWLAFGIAALAVVATHARDEVKVPAILDKDQNVPTEVPVPTEADPSASQYEVDQANEATRAYKKAMSTLSAISTSTAHSSKYTQEPISSNWNSNSILSSFLPNLQGQGPIASFFRILVKLYQQSWLRHTTTNFVRDGLGGSRRKEEELRGKAIMVVDLLQHSAELGHQDALYTLGQISLFPPNSHFPFNPTLAYHTLFEHADATGNASSQALLGFYYSTGYNGTVPVDQGTAQLYYTFAAHGGNKGAQMTMGYRSWAGIGTVEKCERALDWYESASEQAMAKFMSGPPGGRTLPLSATRLSDLDGGVYGPGASFASTGANTKRPAVKAGHALRAGETWEDVLEYYAYNADRGETDFAYRLGKIYYQGSIYASAGGIASGSEGVGAVPRDFQRARGYFLRIARQAWPRDPRNPLQYTPSPPKEDNHNTVPFASWSAGYLGRMFLRGEGVKADAAMAKMWFERGAEYGDRESHNGLGIIWRDGLVQGRTDIKKALEYFAAAAGQDLSEAEINLGKYHYNRRELNLAMTYFESAVRHGSPFEAYYYLAEIQAAQSRSPIMPPEMAASSCAIAVSFHKLVAERGVWGDDLLRDAEIAWTSGTDRGKETALLKWWIAAERGFEVAQNNLAYVLDQDKSVLRLTRFSPMTPSHDTAKLALTQWIRSAAQHDVDALVKVGDYYFHGLGVSEESEESRFEKAHRYYMSAANSHQSALAYWNLGWMYENGVGVPQDFHLAKRNYDSALETNTEAYLPVLLSLTKLYARSIWHTLMGGSDGLSLWFEEDETLFAEHLSERRELDGSQENEGGMEGDEESGSNQEGGSWYLGKAKEEFDRRRSGGAPTEEEDPIQWARDRRNLESERDNDVGPDDDFDGALRGSRRGEEEEEGELGETVLLLLLCLVVAILLFVRTRIAERIRRDQPQQDANGQVPHQPPAPPPLNGGLFPPVGDPAREDWAIIR